MNCNYIINAGGVVEEPNSVSPFHCFLSES